MTCSNPRFSIIIPTCNRSVHLQECLRALENLEYSPGGFEVIVVDDGGTSPLPANRPGNGSSLDVRWIHMPQNRGPAAARNEGAALARGRYLAFLDDDCSPANVWLNRLDDALRGTPQCAVGGKVVNGRPRNVYAEVNQAILDEVYRYYNADPSNAQFFATMNLAVRADDFREMGGFNPSFRASEDREFCARWLKRRLPLVYAEEALVIHNSMPGWREFWTRHFRFGQGAYQFRKTHPGNGSDRMELEPAEFYRRLLVAPLRRAPGPRGLMASGLCCVSQFSSALGFWAAHRRA